MAAVLFLSYDGFMEPIGQSQILQYLERLSKGHRITLVSFEKARDLNDRARVREFRSKAAGAGIRWVALRYHKRPAVLSTAYDLCVGFFVCAYLALRGDIQIVHARSYPPAVVALALKKTLGLRFVFDMRGFWADQRADCGAWSRGTTYRVAKWFERRFLLSADSVISETKAAIDIMKGFEYLEGSSPAWEVISTCTNLDLFRPKETAAAESGQNAPFTLGFVGSLGVWYEFDQMLESFKVLRELRPKAKLLIVSQASHGGIRERVRAAGITEDCAEIRAADFKDVPLEYARMDAGFFFLKSCFSMAAVCPTKLGEFLASGVPCLTNDGIGDSTLILEGSEVGVVLRTRDADAQRLAFQRLLELAADPGISHRCAETARKHFDLSIGIRTIDGIYRSVTGSPSLAGAGI